MAEAWGTRKGTSTGNLARGLRGSCLDSFAACVAHQGHTSPKGGLGRKAEWKSLPLLASKAMGSRGERRESEDRAEGRGPNFLIPALALAQEAGSSLDKLGQD